MPERKEKPDRNGSLVFLHQLSSHIVNRGNVISVYRMAKTERISQESGSKEEWSLVKSNQCPKPGPGVYASQKPIKPNDSGSKSGRERFAHCERVRRPAATIAHHNRRYNNTFGGTVLPGY